MTRLRGRCRRGERLIGKVPQGHWKITTFVAALRYDAITAPFVIDEPMNGEIFRIYLQRCLVPTLKPGDIVVIDKEIYKARPSHGKLLLQAQTVPSHCDPL